MLTVKVSTGNSSDAACWRVIGCPLRKVSDHPLESNFKLPVGELLAARRGVEMIRRLVGESTLAEGKNRSVSLFCQKSQQLF